MKLFFGWAIWTMGDKSFFLMVVFLSRRFLQWRSLIFHYHKKFGRSKRPMMLNWVSGLIFTTVSSILYVAVWKDEEKILFSFLFNYHSKVHENWFDCLKGNGQRFRTKGTGMPKTHDIKISHNSQSEIIIRRFNGREVQKLIIRQCLLRGAVVDPLVSTNLRSSVPLGC